MAGRPPKVFRLSLYEAKMDPIMWLGGNKSKIEMHIGEYEEFIQLRLLAEHNVEIYEQKLLVLKLIHDMISNCTYTRKEHQTADQDVTAKLSASEVSAKKISAMVDATNADGVVIPADHRSIIVTSSVRGKANCHDADTGLDQPATQQALLSGQMTSVAFVDLWQFPRQIKGPRGNPPRDQFHRLLLEPVEGLKLFERCDVAL